MITITGAIKVPEFLSFLSSLMGTLTQQKVEVLSGYPANCSRWLTIYHYRHTNRWSLEWYDKPGYGRPPMLNNDDCLMREANKGASSEELDYARCLLEKTGFWDA
ncbi:hypothetical protein [Duffyella gerundensis]|uniref:hypothetical protein n=1 Tax=Duffyella TaxID=3026546 RepID=UPI003F6E398F